MINLTKSGLFTKVDNDIGILVFSPYTGLIFSCDPKDKAALEEWLNRNTKTPPSVSYLHALGPGWAVNYEDAVYPSPRTLSKNPPWGPTTRPKSPILVNWCITGNCPMQCKYCYADDLMNGSYKEPTADIIGQIASNILRLNPLAVVITGGEPLASPLFLDVLTLLSGRTGIIIDTNGLLMNEVNVRAIKEANAFVRVSLDSDLLKVNDKSRLLKVGNSGAAAAAFNAIDLLITHKHPFAVQSVATKASRVNFIRLGEKLYDLGVVNWLIHQVAPSKNKHKLVDELKGDEKGMKRFENSILRLLRKQYKHDNQKMAFQFVSNSTPNAVILVSPDGTFLTESAVSGQYSKIVIDERNPRCPSIKSINDLVDMWEHAYRYLDNARRE